VGGNGREARDDIGCLGGEECGGSRWALDMVTTALAGLIEISSAKSPAKSPRATSI